MGLLNNIGNMFSNNIWAGVDAMTTSMAEQANSFIYTGGAILNTGISNIGSNGGMGIFNQIANPTYFTYLQKYHFISAILDIFTSCVSDIISRSDFHVEIIGDDEHTTRANKFLDDLQIKQFILDNLRDMIYRGVYAFGIEYKPTNPRLFSLDDPFECKVITNTRDVVGYEINGNMISNNNIACYYYQLEYLNSVSLDEKKDQEIRANLPEEIKDIVVKFKRYDTYGLFDRKLFRIFQMYSLEGAMYLLSLRETLRPTLLGVATGGKQIDLANAMDMANAIEEVLNSPTTGLAQLADPTVYMNQLTWVMLNNIRIMPTLEQYQSLQAIESGENNSKREKLAQELDAIRKEVLQELTIPEELFGGSGTRWDQYTRSDRFISTIDNIIASISRLIKQMVSKYTGISTVSISFNIDTTSLVAAYDNKTKLSNTSERLSDVGRVLESIKSIVENDYCNPVEAYEYLRSQCMAIDEKLGAILIKNLGQTNDGGGDSEGGEDMGGGEDEGGFEL